MNFIQTPFLKTSLAFARVIKSPLLTSARSSLVPETTNREPVVLVVVQVRIVVVVVQVHVVRVVAIVLRRTPEVRVVAVVVEVAIVVPVAGRQGGKTEGPT